MVTIYFYKSIVEPVNVRFEFELIQLLAVDEKAQTITTIVWISYVSEININGICLL